MRLLTSITVLFLLLFTGFVMESSASQTKPSNAPVRILAFGDSLTAGFSLPAKDSYPAQLENLLKREGYDVSIRNAGVSGDTSAQALRRVEWSLKGQNYSWVIVCIGANDGLRLLPLKDLETHLLAIIAKFQKANIRILLVGMKLPTNIEAAYRMEFEKVYARVAKKTKVLFIPFFLEGIATSEMLNLEDQIHPNSQGYAIIAQNLSRKIIPHLRK